MKVKDPDHFVSPNRKPWLILIVLLFAGMFFLLKDKVSQYFEFREEQKTEIVQKDSDTSSDEDTEESGVAEDEKPSKPADDVSATASDKLLKEAKGLEEKNFFIPARNKYLELLKMPLTAETRKTVEQSIGKINTTLALAPHPMPEKVQYVVKPGDSVDKIAKKFGTTVDLIVLNNNISNPNLIKVGDKFRVFSGKFKIKVSKTNIDMVVYMNGEFFKRYSVGTGKYGKTPVGQFVIVDKQKEPVWWHPSGKSYQFGDAENILGTRWMSIKATGDTPDVSGYGIHGTWLPESIGKAESAGCVRMRNKDVEELYTLVPLGTSVEIVE